MKTLLIIIASILSFSSFAECNPQITFAGTNQVTVKEGHKDNVALVDVLVEMSEYCLGLDVSMLVLIREESALVGEHIRAEQINHVTITRGNLVNGFTIGIIGDNDWNEDRTFSLEIINPSHGYPVGAQQVIIENDDPSITVVVPQSIKEPKKGGTIVPIRVELSMPATQRISGEIEILSGTAELENDYIAPRLLGFELLPGDTSFEFTATSDQFIVIADDEKESDESVHFHISSVRGATPKPAQVTMIIQDPTIKYEMTFNAAIMAVAEARVAMTSKYNVTVQLEETDIEGEFASEVVTPKYSHTVVGLPVPPKVSPGKFSTKLKINSSGTIEWLQIEFPVAPTEAYPYYPQPMYMFMSSFSFLHQDEFLSEQTQWNFFRIKRLNTSGEGQWEAIYKRSHREGGNEALREDTKISLKELAH